MAYNEKLYGSQQEADDAEALRKRILEIKDTFWSLCLTIHRADDHTLKTMGYQGKTKGEAMHLLFQSCARDEKRAIDAHIRKYPD